MKKICDIQRYWKQLLKVKVIQRRNIAEMRGEVFWTTKTYAPKFLKITVRRMEWCKQVETPNGKAYGKKRKDEAQSDVGLTKNTGKCFHKKPNLRKTIFNC